MDLNHSMCSTDTDILVRIPSNFFEAELNGSKSYFSNDESFLAKVDNFLQANQRKDVLNSTNHDLPSYSHFADTLQQSQNNHVDQDTDLQLVNIFQRKLQNCQEKIAKLTKANLEKGEIIRKLKANEGLDVLNAKLTQKNKLLEEEIAEMIALITKFQAKNELLESKIESLTINSKEMSDLSKKQINDLEIRLKNSQSIEEEIKKEADEWKVKYNEEKVSRSELEILANSLKKELKHVKDEQLKLRERFEVEKKVTELKQKKVFNNVLSESAEKERKLVKEFDIQRVSMKNYYQAQLEAAIEKKVKEFQDQLNEFQQDIRAESEERERLSNERIVSQMEMIVRKNEEEIDLIKQKCAEEVDLYRIQLINATKTIESLETKLGDYQAKRQNIADNLHSIMETQWRKILDVLTCPSQAPSHAGDETNEITHEISESDNNKQHQYEPVMNNLSKSEENLKSELLRNYIDKLLNQPPKNGASDDEKLMNRSKSRSKKPWK